MRIRDKNNFRCLLCGCFALFAWWICSSLWIDASDATIIAAAVICIASAYVPILSALKHRDAESFNIDIFVSFCGLVCGLVCAFVCGLVCGLVCALLYGLLCGTHSTRDYCTM